MMFRDVARQHGRWAMGVLGWSPDVFWAATPMDVTLAWQGWCAWQGIDAAASPCSRADMHSLLQHFPD